MTTRRRVRMASNAKTSNAKTKRSSGSSRSGSGASRASAGHNGKASRGSLTASEAVERARTQLSELLARPVETVLGVDRDAGQWVVSAEVVELERIPSTTDVLG